MVSSDSTQRGGSGAGAASGPSWIAIVVSQALVVALGLFVYDLVRGNAGRAEGDGASGVADSAADDAGLDDEGGAPSLVPRVEAMSAESSRALAGIERNARRLQELEAMIKTWMQVSEARSGGEGLTDAQRAGVDLGTPEEVAAGDFKESTIVALRAYMEEIRLRQIAERRHRVIKAQIDRMELALPDSQMDAVVREMMAFQDRTKNLTRTEQDRQFGDTRSPEKQEAFRRLRQDLEGRLRGMVSDEQAAKIMGTQLGKTGGWFTLPEFEPPPKGDGGR